jgi:hypothetical protein
MFQIFSDPVAQVELRILGLQRGISEADQPVVLIRFLFWKHV